MHNIDIWIILKVYSYFGWTLKFQICLHLAIDKNMVLKYLIHRCLYFGQTSKK